MASYSTDAQLLSATQRQQHYWEDHLADEFRLEDQAEWLRHSREHYARWVRKYMTGGKRALKTDSFEEIRGSEVVDAMQERFERVVVQDLAYPALVQSLERRGRPELGWVQTPVQRQPFKDKSFDGIVSFSTLDHFRTCSEIKDSLRELARITRPGGELLITLDNAANPLIAARNCLPYTWLRKLNLAPYEYGKTLGPYDFRHALEECGWKVRTFSAVLHEPRVLAVALAKYCRADGVLTPKRYRALLHQFRRLESLPTRMWTGYFLIAVAERQDRS
jgi:SAM-dependent methyltransferase